MLLLFTIDVPCACAIKDGFCAWAPLCISLFLGHEAARMQAEKAKAAVEGLDEVRYPSKEQLESGSHQEPSQRMGDYALIRSHRETGRVFSAIRDLGVEGGVVPGTEVCRRDNRVRNYDNLLGFSHCGATVQPWCSKEVLNQNLVLSCV